MKFFSVVLCAFSLWFSVLINFTEANREITAIPGLTRKYQN